MARNCSACGAEMAESAQVCPGCGQPAAAGGCRSPAKILTCVIVLLAALGGLIVIGGIFAAIAVPNLLNAIERGRQKRTMADMKLIGIALDAYLVDHQGYPVTTEIDALEPLLEPRYIASLPKIDGFGHPFRIETTEQSYRIVSAGKDGQFQGCGGGATKSPEEDICLVDGVFDQWPLRLATGRRVKTD